MMADSSAGSDFRNECFGSQLAVASDENLRLLSEFVSSITPQQGISMSDYGKALQAAAQMIERTMQIEFDLGLTELRPEETSRSNSPPIAVILVTAGGPWVGNPPLGQVWDTATQRIGNKPYLFTYGLRKTVDPALNALKTLSESTDGQFELTDTRDVTVTLGTYYEHQSFVKDPPAEQGDPPPPPEGEGGIDPNLIWTTPYRDSGGLGLVVTAALPIWNRTGNALLGVAGVDLTVEDLVEEALRMSLSYDEQIYVFVVDEDGRTYVHPQVPTPAAWRTRHELGLLPPQKLGLLVHISQLETEEAFSEEILPDLLAGKDGRKVIEKYKSTPRSGSSSEGVIMSSTPHPAAFHYRAIGNSPFRICVVVWQEESGDASEQDLAWQTQMADVGHPGYGVIPTLYHRLDLLENRTLTVPEVFGEDPPLNPLPPDEAPVEAPSTELSFRLCNHFGTLATMDFTTVQWSLSVWKSPQQFVDTVVDEDFSQRLTNFLNGDPREHHPNRTSLEPNGIPSSGDVKSMSELLHAEVYRDHVLTSSIDEVWLASDEFTNEYIVWRYIATKSGLIRIYPANAQPRDYDATQRDWYRRTVALNTMMNRTELGLEEGESVIAISAPYVDSFGSGIVITVSMAIFEGHDEDAHTHDGDEDESEHGGHDHDHGSHIAGVIGMDVTIGKLQSILDEASSHRCSKLDERSACILMDNSGYVIVHPQFLFLDQTADASLVEGKWIGELEPALAHTLQSLGALEQQQCNDFDTETVVLFHQIPDRTLLEDVQIEGCTTTFSMEPVNGTNTFLVVLSDVDLHCDPPLTCTCCKLCQSGGRDCREPVDCNCPCTCGLDIQSCENEFVRNNLPACPPPQPALNYTELPMAPPGLEQCVPVKPCAGTPFEICAQRIRCETCLFAEDGTYLDPDERFCADVMQCPRGPAIYPDNSWDGECLEEPLPQYVIRPPEPCVRGETFSRSGFEPCQPCLGDCSVFGDSPVEAPNAPLPAECTVHGNRICPGAPRCEEGFWSTTGFAPCQPCTLRPCRGHLLQDCTPTSDTLCTDWSQDDLNRIFTGWQDEVVVWEAEGYRGELWSQAQIPLENLPGKVEIEIQHLFDPKHPLEYFAIDDIQILYGERRIHFQEDFEFAGLSHPIVFRQMHQGCSRSAWQVVNTTHDNTDGQ